MSTKTRWHAWLLVPTHPFHSCSLKCSVTNITLARVQTCLWVQGSRSESSWQLLTAVLLLVCWKDENAKSLEKVLQIRGSVQSPEFPEFFWNGSEKSRVPENSGVMISSRRSQEV